MSVSIDLIQNSLEFESKMFNILELPLALDIERFQLSATLCHISFEHWCASRKLLEYGMFPSALTILRSQFEALVRSIWVQNLATNEMIDKLFSDLNKESEQNAKNIHGVHDMISAIVKSLDEKLSKPLVEIKLYSWNALNSFTHSGIHAISRCRNGFPQELVDMSYRQSNGIALMTGMQFTVLCGMQSLQKELIKISEQHSICMPPKI